MTLTDNRKIVVDKPFYDALANLPLVSSTGVGMCGSDDTSRQDLYLSYFQNLWRYCGKTDGFQQLCPKHLLNTTRSALKFSKNQGYRGNCLGATNSTMDIAGLNADDFNGLTIRITSGTGIGQERTILDTGYPVIYDRGLATTATASALTDSTKKWKVNQFIGYQVRITQNAGVTQVRKVLYNDSTALYFYDANYQQLECWNNNPFCAVAPYAAPNAVAGTQAHYVIEKSTITVDTNWTTNPDFTSSYVISGGGFFNLGGFATTPFSAFEYYDALSDS